MGIVTISDLRKAIKGLDDKTLVSVAQPTGGDRRWILKIRGTEYDGVMQVLLFKVHNPNI